MFSSTIHLFADSHLSCSCVPLSLNPKRSPSKNLVPHSVFVVISSSSLEGFELYPMNAHPLAIHQWVLDNIKSPIITKVASTIQPQLMCEYTTKRGYLAVLTRTKLTFDFMLFQKLMSSIIWWPKWWVLSVFFSLLFRDKWSNSISLPKKFKSNVARSKDSGGSLECT